ncbi:MAG TPA: hypothetical protein VM682_08160, partial [Bacillus sp. (in: firmicutes)]|nr:hypothetical protein [Bacillus sp. (in: firmicutes)]
KIMNTNLILRIISFASEIGISFARPLQASQSVDDTLIYTLFDNNSGLYSSSLHMIKRSSIQYLSQCTSADGSVMLSYKDAFKRNSIANPGTRIPKWYQHIISYVCHNNSLRIKNEFLRLQTPINNIIINRPFERAPVPQRNIRAAFWCSTWNDSTQAPILGKAVYTHPSSLQFQHWTPVVSTSNNTTTTLTPTSSRLQLKECEGCHLNNNYTFRRTSQYLDQFPCRIACQHNNALKLTIRPTTLFDREATLKFNTTLANLTSDIKASFTPITDQPIQRPIPREYEYGRVSLNFTNNSVTHNINTDTRTTIKSIFDAINFQDILHLKRWETIKSFSDQSGIDWIATWALFSSHFCGSKTGTTFKKSSAISFRTKLLMEELPLQNKLVLRNPEIYKKDWKCMLCDQEQESWSHLWRCSHLLPRLTALQQATKKGFEDLLSTTVPNRSSTFKSKWDDLSCWTLQQQRILTTSHLITSFKVSSHPPCLPFC